MRYAMLLLAVSALLATGCSRWVASSGHPLHITSHEDARAEFGPPVAEGTRDDGKPFEEFRSRRKYAERDRGNTHIMTTSFTLGLAQFKLLPQELWLLTRRICCGETIRVIYQPDGNVDRVLIGDSFWNVNRWK